MPWSCLCAGQVPQCVCVSMPGKWTLGLAQGPLLLGLNLAPCREEVAILVADALRDLPGLTFFLGDRLSHYSSSPVILGSRGILA